jgi:hypothetical protein
MSAKSSFARNLASALLAGPWLAEEMCERAARATGMRGRWRLAIIQRILEAFGEQGAGVDLESLTRFLKADRDFVRAWRLCVRRGGPPPHEIFWLVNSMTAGVNRKVLELPALATSTALAEWLGLHPSELDWFADCEGRQVKAPPGPLHHYTYRWLPKPSGGARLLEMPKRRLKAIQRCLLRELLDASRLTTPRMATAAADRLPPMSGRTAAGSSCCASICAISSLPFANRACTRFFVK